MGVNLKELVFSKEIDLATLRNKKIAIDAYNTLYQFLSNIRQLDGTPLMDSQGRITSHLVGLFFRTANLLMEGILPVFVFDGKPPEEKYNELEKRKKLKEEAKEKYEEAVLRKDLEAMKKYASRTSMLTSTMIEDAKRLISLLGCPIVQAPHEGEAQAAYMAKKGDVFAVSSQDYDALLFGAPVLIKNLALTGKRKLPNKPIYTEIKPEIIKLKDVLEKNDITQDQLIAIAIMVGTDFNPGGIKGIGVKKALNIVKNSKDLEEAFKKAEWDKHYNISWQHIFDIFKNMEVNEEYNLQWKEPDEEGIIQFLVHERSFSEERIKNYLSKIKKSKAARSQSTLSKFFL